VLHRIITEARVFGHPSGFARRRTIEVFFLKVVFFQEHEGWFNRNNKPKRDQQFLDCSLNGRREKIGHGKGKI
jgi:hypothetical protein